MKYGFKTDGDIVISTLSGNIMGGPDYERFHGEVKDLIEQGRRQFLFDFGGVKWVNSTGVGIMVSVYTSLRSAEGRMVICKANERVRGTYYVSQLDNIFETFDTVEEGMKALTGA